MIRQLKQFNVSRLHPEGGMAFAVSGYEPRPHSHRSGRPGSGSAHKFPQRPDGTMISEAIPLFYITRNNTGFWLAREANGRTGGLFLFKRSALRFARSKSLPVGCGLMFLAEPFDLDVENQGSRVAGFLCAASEVVARRAPLLGSFVGSVVAEWRKLIAEISETFASRRRHRDAIEKELFRGQYTLCSKNDDDLPIP
jgi:hypothetical protein